MYIVGFSGPPRSGKDTLAGLLQSIVEDRHVIPTLTVSLSEPMGRQLAGLLGLTFTTGWYESTKDVPMDILNSMTPRQFYIANSENFMKAQFGNDIWIRIALDTMARNGFTPRQHGLVLITNYGFEHEPRMFDEVYGPDNCLTVLTHRDGKNFNGDSRSYVSGANQTNIHNNEDPMTEARRIYGRLINQFQWTF